jgi:hypothetical protein
MFKDPQFMITLQMGLIGIVLVAGFYLIWKALTRIEEKVDLVLLDKQSQQFFQNDRSSEQTAESMVPSTDAMMKAMFSEDMEELSPEGFVIFSSPFQMPPEEDFRSRMDSREEVIEESENVHIEELKPDMTAESDVTITNIGYSKTKLKTMSVDKLKELCHERQLSTEGTKNQLIQRLLE